jgi:hypothetical protein
MRPKRQNRTPGAGRGPGAQAGGTALRLQGERTSNIGGGPRPRQACKNMDERREPAVPVTAATLIGCDRYREAHGCPPA